MIRSVVAADAAALATAVESIRVNDLRRHASVLASDTFEGREAGTRGGKAAGVYVVEQLKKLPLAPAAKQNSYYQHFGYDYRNILAVLPGSDPELKQQYLLVGAHYDHVGYGTWRNSRGPIGRIHNGADDNASGTSGLLELIEALANLQPHPKRSILFAFWDAEEKGLAGSQHWVSRPTIPLEQVRLLFNLDMIGRLRDRNVEIYGIRTASGLRRLISEQNRRLGLYCDFNWDTPRNSDHYPFLQQRIPFLMLHTRKHADYHRPSDDIDKLNIDGMQQLIRLLFRMVYAAAEKPQLPRFRSQSFAENQYVHRQWSMSLPALPSRLGVSWNSKLDQKHVVKLTGVAPGSPADDAGLKIGDQILEFDGFRIDQVDDFRTVVLAARNSARVLVRRDGKDEPLRISIQLHGQPRRLGIAWRVDVAEPNSVILTRVAPGSPADLAGLRVNDRIYSVSGKDFSSSDEFYDLVTAPKRPFEMVVESHGRVREVTVPVLPPRN